MKKVIFLLLPLIIFSCKKRERVVLDDVLPNKIETKEIEKDTIKKEISKKTNNFQIDSIIIKDSAYKKGEYVYNSTFNILVFPTIKDEVFLNSIYAPISENYKHKFYGYSKEELFKQFKTISRKTKQDVIGDIADLKKTNSYYSNGFQNFEMGIIETVSDFKTINYFLEGMYFGAVHPFHNQLFITFDFKNKVKIHLDEIFLNSDKVWKKIIPKYIPKEMVFEEYEKSIPKTENFYFDEKHIYFNYNEYEIGPYVSSLIVVRVPFSELKPYLKPDFAKRMNIK